MQIFGYEVAVWPSLRQWSLKMVGYVALIVLVAIAFIAIATMKSEKEGVVQAAVYNITLTSETAQYARADGTPGEFKTKKFRLLSNTPYIIIVDSEGEPKAKLFKFDSGKPYVVKVDSSGEEPELRALPMRDDRSYQFGETGLMEIDRGLWDTDSPVEGWQIANIAVDN